MSEINFDGLVGPSHNYAGLSFGNIASWKNKHAPSNPRQAALQGLNKIRMLLRLGISQGILPPQERPHIQTLKTLGFSGSDADILRACARDAPELLALVSSASAMWAANAATIAPSCDTTDGFAHFTPANLPFQLHRSLETKQTATLLRTLFPPPHFHHHSALPSHIWLGDEGAANHMRFCKGHNACGVHVFVYGRDPFRSLESPKQFPPRQSAAASAAIARNHNIKSCLLLQQAPEAIDSGAFHNDVVAVANENVLLYHEGAFAKGKEQVAALKELLYRHNISLIPLCIAEAEISLRDAIATYLFNSQLVTLPSGAMALIAPIECQDHKGVCEKLGELCSDPANPIEKVYYIDVRESMRNGGGPACLRLRIVLTEEEKKKLHPSALVDEAKVYILENWVKRHYRDRLTPDDLGDPQLLDECHLALDELTQLLELGPIYPFQKYD